MTKNFKSYVLSALAVAAIAFSGCSKNDEGMTPTQKKDFSVVLSSASTKTTNSDMSTLWAADDAINLFHCVAGEETPTYVSDGEFKTSENGATVTFTGTLADGFDDTKTYNWYAFYPYTKQVKTPANTSSGYVVVGSQHNAKQSQDGNNTTAHISGPNYPVVGVVEKLAGTEKPLFTMKHLTSLVEVKVKNGTTAPITISSVALKAVDLPAELGGIVGTYYIDFASSSSPIYTPSGATYVSNTANLEVNNGEEIAPNGTASFYLAVKPFRVNDGDDFTIAVTGPNGIDEKTISASKDFDFVAGKKKTINFTYDKSTLVYDFENCAKINELAEAAGSTSKSYYGYLTNAVISFVPASDTRVAIIKDNTGSAYLYKASHGFKQGQKFTGELEITVSQYNGLNEVTAINAEFEGPEATVTPEDLAIATLKGNYTTYQNRYAKLTDVQVTSVTGKTVNISDGTNDYVIYTQYGNATCIAGDKVTATGTIVRNNTTEELKVWNADDFVVTYHPTTTHKITFTQPTDGSGSFTVKVDGSNITSGTEVEEGKEVTLTATAATGFNFNSWTVEGATVSSTSSPTATFTVGTSDVTISAYFTNASTSVTVTYDFTAAASYPDGFPTATGTSTSSPTTFTLDGKSIVLYAPNAYYEMTNGSAKTLFFGKSATSFSNTAYIEVPAKAGYYIESISVKNSSGCAANVNVNIYNTSGTTVSTSVKTVKGATMNFLISPHTTNVPYRIASLDSGKNFQFDSIEIVYNK